MTWALLLVVACRSTPPPASSPPSESPQSTATGAVDTQRPTETGSTADSAAPATPLAHRECAPEPTWENLAGRVTIDAQEQVGYWDRFDIRASFYNNEPYDENPDIEPVPSDDPTDDCQWVENVYDPESHGEKVSGGHVTVSLAGQSYLLKPFGNNHDYDAPELGLVTEEVMASFHGATISIESTGSPDVPAFSFPDIELYPPHRIDVSSPMPNAALAPDDIVFRWEPGTTLDGRMEVHLSPKIPKLMICMIDDDGEWSPPPAVFEHMNEPERLVARFLARKPCPQKLPDGRIVTVWLNFDASLGIDVTP